MKKIWKSAFVVFALAAFTACGGGENTTETETTEQVESDMETETETEMETDTTTVQDTTVNDGVADDMQEEQPPVQ
ncbi:hypothetical protein H8S95_18260 [Pontibacter sp. KCTC 32443]|uniref:hypothetical protein n=1 Tax=Pontibacter TaxID=323449 RepID=UPI00164DC52B|nr:MULTISPECIES: hypothetical protein [Pontibacter]MBC5776026.1 hypothetical protein [Pontibacter sp. KCTC 32443]